MVPLTLKVIAVPTAQSPFVVSLPAFALLIASRKVHRPSFGVASSERVLTVITATGGDASTDKRKPSKGERGDNCRDKKPPGEHSVREGHKLEGSG